MPERDRDRSLEPVLRHVLSSAPTTPQSVCLDGETLAAWSDGLLDGAQASTVERHVADCARCRALMAALIQTTPDRSATEPLWRRWRLSWVVPLATAATAAALWVALPGNTPVADQSEGSAIAQVSRESVPPTAGPETAAAPAELATPRAAVAPPPGEPAAAKTKQTELESRLPDASLSAQAPAAPAPQFEKVESTSRAAEAPAAANDALAKRAEADANGTATRSVAGAFARQAAPAVEIASPDGSTRWRIVGGQQVERLTSATAAWMPVQIEASDGLTTGAAPSSSVCWIVGHRGAVFLTTDGTRFRRLPFPEMLDLVSVVANGDRIAIVTSADGRSWQTTDQGATWARR